MLCIQACHVCGARQLGIYFHGHSFNVCKWDNDYEFTYSFLTFGPQKEKYTFYIRITVK